VFLHRWDLPRLTAALRFCTGEQACFHTWQDGGKITWLPWQRVVDHVAELATQHGINVIYMASDNQHPTFREKVRLRLQQQHAQRLLPMVQETALYLTQASAEHHLYQDNLEHSLLEQEIALQASVFVGTVSSTWSSQVAVERRWAYGVADTHWLAAFDNLPAVPTVGIEYFP
jgi:hypothetical protein